MSNGSFDLKMYYNLIFEISRQKNTAYILDSK